MATVRLATKGDIPRILDLYCQLAITTSQAEPCQNPTPDDCQRVFAEISNSPGHELLVAEDEGEVVGSLVLLIVPNLSHEGRPWALVENVVVDEQYRRRGIGRLLMNYAVGKAKETGCHKIGLSSDTSRKEAHKFYRSMGFEASAHGFRLYF